MPLFLAVLLIDLWVIYLKIKATKEIKWVLLEIKIPRDIEKTPRAMEQVFSGLHGILVKVKFLDKYWKGKVQEWFSLEIAGINGVVYFFVRTPEKFRNLVEAQIQAQYPEAEIMEVMDYAASLVGKIPSKTYDLGGIEFILDKADYYPIRTFLSFEERVKERRLDPMASFLEIISKLKPDENIFIQCLVKPTREKDWKDKGLEAVNKLVGKKMEAKKSIFGGFWDAIYEFITNLFKAVIVYPEWGEAKKEEIRTAITALSPGDKLVAEAIENKISKLAFRVCVRFVYIAKRDVFNPGNISSIIGSFKQFNTLNLNAFRPNGKASTLVPQPRIIPFIKKRREFLRKINIISRYARRAWPVWPLKDFILNTEELATIYHYPIVIVETPTMRRVEAKKAEPPIGLPVE